MSFEKEMSKMEEIQRLFEEEQNKEVRIPKGSSADLHFQKELPEIEEVDDKFNKGKRKNVYTFKVVNLHPNASKQVKTFKASQSTFKKLSQALKSGIQDIELFNPTEQNAAMILRESQREYTGEVEEE